MTELYFWEPKDISGTAEVRVVKFFMQVGYIKLCIMDDKTPENGRGQSHMTHFKFWGRKNISGMAETSHQILYKAEYIMWYQIHSLTVKLRGWLH